jgi:hypothetical protein
MRRFPRRCFSADPEHVQWNLEVADPVVFRRWQPAGADVDLDGRQDQRGHPECDVARLAHLHELLLADTVEHMDVLGTLLGDRRFLCGRSPLGRIVVAHEHFCLGRECE